MQTRQRTTFKNQFEEEVYKGLTAFPKYLSSKYFYDQKGDKLFQRIMELPEYYLTQCEFDILSRHKRAIIEEFSIVGGFDLIELGAGDGKKTKILLRELKEQEKEFTYQPIDISGDVLRELKASVNKELPNVDIQPQKGAYFEVLKDLAAYNKRKKVILVLGSNIGNLPHEKAVDFLTQIQQSMHKGDLLFMGFDQKKDPSVILNAYNDSQGVTEAFNKNLLHRINREMEADFDPERFMHWPTYDPETGTTKSFLVSKERQEVSIDALKLAVTLEKWESIHTEISQKYDDSVIEWLATESGLVMVSDFADEKRYFKDYLFKKKTE